MIRKFYPYEYVDSVFAIDYKKILDLGYRGIIFDIDNTLVHHGDDSNEKIDALFTYIQSLGIKTLLLSNNSSERIERFKKNINTMYISEADKPSTDGYEKATVMLGMGKEKLVVIGDQLFTDILGANRCNIASILVKFMRRETEKKIGKKRMLEKVILEIYSLSKYKNRIGDILLKGDGDDAEEEKVVL